MITIDTTEDRAVKLGKSYFFAGANNTLANNSFIDILLKADEHLDFYLRSMIIDADAESATLEMYLDPVVTVGAGTNGPLYSRNRGAQNNVKPVVATQGPTITTQGDSLFPQPRHISGQSAPGNNAFMYVELLTGGYIIPKGKSVLFRISNTSGSARSFSILMSGRENI